MLFPVKTSIIDSTAMPRLAGVNLCTIWCATFSYFHNKANSSRGPVEMTNICVYVCVYMCICVRACLRASASACACVHDTLQHPSDQPTNPALKHTTPAAVQAEHRNKLTHQSFADRANDNSIIFSRFRTLTDKSTNRISTPNQIIDTRARRRNAVGRVLGDT